MSFSQAKIGNSGVSEFPSSGSLVIFSALGFLLFMILDHLLMVVVCGHVFF